MSRPVPHEGAGRFASDRATQAAVGGHAARRLVNPYNARSSPMSLYTEDGTRVTKASIATTPDTDPIVTLDVDLYKREAFGANDGDPKGSIRTLFAAAGTPLRQSD